ncbi:MAG: Na(+)-translocating NADH-quinone reductase subunit F [Patiriisocius sp.]|uniref:Na(+)-translocating NADH-quinone reductase subunit F n=1 Tax=Patiriisocius sp. TaxID=2822396 RepID=UPI003EF51FD1
MNTTFRFEAAISKLYDAFYNNELNPLCCKQCAVGNICDNKDAWKHLSDFHGSTQLNYVGVVHQRLGRKINGYSPVELLTIEATFLKACGFSIPLIGLKDNSREHVSNEQIFDGMVSVIDLLCELDGITNPMAYKAIFRNELDSKKSSKIINETATV